VQQLTQIHTNTDCCLQLSALGHAFWILTHAFCTWILTHAFCTWILTHAFCTWILTHAFCTWILPNRYQVDVVSATATSVTVDLADVMKSTKGNAPAAVRYSWGVFDCCNTGDSMLYIGKPCDNPCPITSSSSLPANPFIAKLVDGKCSCVPPQVC
jgi:hypothetical protein